MEKSMLENLGKLGRDKITDFEGIITGFAKHFFGCDSYLLTSKIKDGKSYCSVFDIGRIEIIGDGIATSEELTNITRDENPQTSMIINLGKLGRDKVTGFEGIITAIAKYLYGCDSYFLTSKANEGKSGKTDKFDKGRIEIIGDGIELSEVQADKPGGEDLSSFFN